MNKQVINDNKINMCSIVKKIYKGIFKLPTKELEYHEKEVFKELISRKDYNDINFLIDKYKILQTELISRGVEL